MFQDTSGLAEDGKFIVHLPFNHDPAVLGDSDNMDVLCLNLEKRLTKDPILCSRYVDFMHGYELLGHISKIHNPTYILKSTFIYHTML